MTQINLLPLVTLSVAASQDGDLSIPLAFMNAGGTPIDLTGIAFRMVLKAPGATTLVGFDTASGPYVVNSGAQVTVAVPCAQWASVFPGVYVGDLVASAEGVTVVVGALTVTQARMGGCRIVSLVSAARNAATATSVGYIPGPGWDQYRGDYSATVGYVRNDTVYFAVSTWIALGPTTGNAPAVGSAYWHLVAPGVDPAALTAATASATNAAAAASAAGGNAATSAAAASTQAAAAAASAATASASASAAASAATGAAGSAAAASTSATAADASSTSAAASAASAASSAAATKSIPARQTVQSGPLSSGAPSFLPPTTASLSLTAQGVTPSSPLSVAAAQGYGAAGAADVFVRLTANPTWAGLPPSATIYLFINAQTGATATSTLPPIYQFGGAISTASGQFTFDIAQMVGYMGSGTSAVATPLVCVGEAVTNASAVASTIAYAYNGYYDSGWTAGLPAAGNTPKNNNLGLTAGLSTLVLENTTAEGGFVVGDQIRFAGQYYYYSNTGVFNYNARNSSTVTIFGSIYVYAKNGSAMQLTSANWKYKVIAARGWAGA